MFPPGMVLCVFCDRERAGDFIAENGLAAAFPVSLGHSVAIPRRREANFHAAPSDECLQVHRGQRMVPRAPPLLCPQLKQRLFSLIELRKMRYLPYGFPAPLALPLR